MCPLKKTVLFSVLFLICSPLFAEPREPDINKLHWHVLNTKNFTIYSLNERQGRYLESNIEEIKMWAVTRWGLPDVEFDTPCKVMCVPDQYYLKKLFNLDESTSGTLATKGNKAEMVLFLNLGNCRPREIIPSALVGICLKQLEIKTGVKFDFWLYRGLSILNKTPSQIQTTLKDSVYKLPVDGLMKLTEEQWLKAEEKDRFDAQAAMLCLLCSKEFGKNNFLKIILINKDALDFAELDDVFRKYAYHLVNDMQRSKVPMAYFEQEEP